MIERSRVRIPAGTAGEFSSPGSTFCADSYFGIRYHSSTFTRIHRTYVAFIEPCFGIGHNLSLICQMTSEDIKHQLIFIFFSYALHIMIIVYNLSRVSFFSPSRSIYNSCVYVFHREE